MVYGDAAPELTSLDHYQIIRKIGRGGQGDVYLAHDPHLDIDVAIKVLHAEYREPEFIRRLTLEARIMVRLAAPNIVRIYNLNPRYPYLVMEYCADGDLNQLIKSRNPLPLSRWVSLARQICEALMVAHEQDDPILHRDLKPGNVMFHKGVPKVADFGLAKVLGGASSGMTMSRGMMGTVGYASPEQLKDASKVDHRTDIWAVGVILYELLTFRGPFETPGDDDFVNTAIRVRTEPPAEPPWEIPRPLWQVILRALEKDPDARYASARELAQALDEAIAAIPNADALIVPPESSLGELDHLASKTADSFSSGSIENARALVEKMKEIAPEDSLARYWERRLRDATSESRRSDSSTSTGSQAHLDSIRSLLARRQYAEARRECGKVLIESPDDASVHDLLLRITEEERALTASLDQSRREADAARARGDADAVLAIWRGMDERFPEHPDIRAELAVAESELRARARRAAWEATKRRTDELVGTNRHAEAAALLDEYVGRFPEDAEAAGLRDSIRAELAERTQAEHLGRLRQEARDLAAKGVLDRALEIWKEILAEAPTEEGHLEAETVLRAIAERDRRAAVDGARAAAAERVARGDVRGALAVWSELRGDHPTDPDVAREIRELEQRLEAAERAAAGAGLEAGIARLAARVEAGRYRGLPEVERQARAGVDGARSGLSGNVERLRAAAETLDGIRTAAEHELDRALTAERRGIATALERAAEMLDDVGGEVGREPTAAERELDGVLARASTALSTVGWPDDPGDPLGGLVEVGEELRRATEALVRERRAAIDAARSRAASLLAEAGAAVAGLSEIPGDATAGDDAAGPDLSAELARLAEASESNSAERLEAVAAGALEIRERARAARAVRVASVSARLGRLLDESAELVPGADGDRLRTVAARAAAALDAGGADAEKARASLLAELGAAVAEARAARERAEASARAAWSAAARDAKQLGKVSKAAGRDLERVHREGEAALAASRFAEVEQRATQLAALARAARVESIWERERGTVEALEGPVDDGGVPARPPAAENARGLAGLRRALARGAWDDVAGAARELRERAGHASAPGGEHAADVPAVPTLSGRARRLNERLHPAALERFDRDVAAWAETRDGSPADLARLAAAAARSHDALLRPPPRWPRLAAVGAAVAVLAVAAVLAVPRPGPAAVTLVSPVDVKITGVRRDGSDVLATLGSATTVTADGLHWTLEPGSYVVTTEQGAEVRFDVPRDAAVFVPSRVADPSRELSKELGLEELMGD